MVELSLSNARNMLAGLMENHRALPHDIFDYKSEMHEDVVCYINAMLPLAQKRMLSFFEPKVSDLVCYGRMCSGLWNSTTDINIGFVLNIKLNDSIIKNINVSLLHRGYVFKIYGHQVKFSVLRKNTEIGANWSIKHQKWNKQPLFQDFKFDLDYFLMSYQQLNREYHEALDNLKKNAAGFYTPESCQIIQNYFDTKEKQALGALYHHPEHEYSLAYNLWRALDVLGIIEHFRQEIIDSQCFYLNEALDE